MEFLHAFHAAMGQLVVAHGGTLERFAGDSVMIFFNDPVPMERPAEAAVRMALAMQQAFPPLAEPWRKSGFELGLGCGIATGCLVPMRMNSTCGIARSRLRRYSSFSSLNSNGSPPLRSTSRTEGVRAM